MNSLSNLREKVRRVRRQLLAQVLVKKLSLFILLAVFFIVLSICGMEMLGYQPAWIWSVRLLCAVGILCLAVSFLYLPFRQRISDNRIAQLVEERYPQLEDRLVTSIEYGREKGDNKGLLALLFKDALEKTERLDFSIFFNRGRAMAFGLICASALLCLVFLVLWGPSFFSYGFSRLYFPWVEAAGSEVFSMQVTPGNQDLVRGTDQQITARLAGFDSREVTLFMQPDARTAWTRLAMEPEQRSSRFQYLLVDLQSSVRYFVEAKGIRSPEYMLKVIDLPRVEAIDLTYHFPSYTRMEPRKIEGDGDVTALKGTRVDVRVRANRGARSARLVFEDKSEIPLVSENLQTFAGGFVLQHSGTYTVEFESVEGRRHAGSPEYAVEALEDQPPKVFITKPLRDLRATNLEEVFAEFRAEDDIGVAKLELRYSVNGGEEKTVSLHNGKSPARSLTASHIFYLEEFGLQPGDLISYYGRTEDANNVTGPGIASSDIYFIQVRPFDQKVTQNQQGASQGNSSGPQESLSNQQKQIISATFKSLRDKSKLDAKEYAENLKALALVQNRLQDQAKGLATRLQRRGTAQIEGQFSKLAQYLGGAILEMGTAGARLSAQKPAEALISEQKALQQLLRGESLFREIQISIGNANGGRGTQANAEDLAELFELELNKLKNQYETVQRGENQAADQKVDEALQRLKELAQRQQQLNERNRLPAQMGTSGGSSGGSRGQQELLEESEKLQRQLQRLSRERNSPELNLAENRLQEAIREMRRTLEQSRQGKAKEAGADGIRALQQLEDAQRALSLRRYGDLKRSMQQVGDESRNLIEEQNRIQEGVNRLANQKDKAAQPEHQKTREGISERKNLLAERIKELGAKIESLARDARKTQKDSGANLNAAAELIRDQRLPESVLRSKQLLDSGNYEMLKGREEGIRRSLEEVNKKLQAARAGLTQPKEAKLEEALQKTRSLAEALESLQERLAAGRPSKDGQSNRQGSPSQQASGKAEGSDRQPGQPASGGAAGERQPGTPDVRSGAAAGSGGGISTPGMGRPGGIGRQGDEALRQLQAESQQRVTDINELRRLLDRNATRERNLDQVIDELRKMGTSLAAGEGGSINRLTSAINLLRQIEQELNRALDRLIQKDRYFYAEEREVPPGYKQLVEEYYKALAKSGPPNDK